MDAEEQNEAAVDQKPLALTLPDDAFASMRRDANFVVRDLVFVAWRHDGWAKRRATASTRRHSRDQIALRARRRIGATNRKKSARRVLATAGLAWSGSEMADQPRQFRRIVRPATPSRPSSPAPWPRSAESHDPSCSRPD